MQPTSRVDATGNRERIVSAARDEFALGRATVPLESIARAAGVGIGTCYRHFPTREALIDEICRLDLDARTEQADTLLGGHRAFDAFPLWMNELARFLATKRTIRDALRRAAAGAPGQTPVWQARTQEAVTRIVDERVRNGTIKPSARPADVSMIVEGSMISASIEDKDQLCRAFGLVAAGLAVA